MVILTKALQKSFVSNLHMFYVAGRMQVKPNKQPVIVSVPICHYEGQFHFVIYSSGWQNKRKM